MFREEEHPRDKGGRFSAKGGGAYHYDPKNYKDPVERNSFREVAARVTEDIAKHIIASKPRLQEHIEKNGAVLDGYGGKPTRTEAFAKLWSDRLMGFTSDKDVRDINGFSYAELHALKPELTEFLHSTLNRTANWLEPFEAAEKEMAKHHPVYFGSSAIGGSHMDLTRFRLRGLDGSLGETAEELKDKVHLYKAGVRENGQKSFGTAEAKEKYGVKSTQNVALFLRDHSEGGNKSFSLDNGKVGFDVHVTHFRQNESIPDYIQAKVDIKTSRSTIKGARLVLERQKVGRGPTRKQRHVGYSGGWKYTGQYNITFDFPRTSMTHKGEKHFPYKHIDASTKDNIEKTLKLLLHQMDGGKEPRN